MSTALAPVTGLPDVTITGLRAWTVRFALTTPLAHATTDTPALESVVVQVALADGAMGWSEVRGNGAYATGEDTAQIATALRAVGCGSPHPTAPGPLVDRLLSISRLAAMAVDVATWDATARAQGVPLHWLWAPGPYVPAAVRTHAQIGFADHATAAGKFAAVGFDRIKVRVGSVDHREDVARLAAICQSAPNVELIVDANGGWTPAQALWVGQRLTDLPVAWLEQPVATLAGLKELRGRLPVPVYADELARDNRSVQDLAGLVDGVHLKLEKAGTVAALMSTVATARRAGLAVALGQMDQGRLGCAATTHLAAALRLPRAELWGCAAIVDDLTDDLHLDNGLVTVPTGPGNGINQIDTSMLKELR